MACELHRQVASEAAGTLDQDDAHVQAVTLFKDILVTDPDLNAFETATVSFTGGNGSFAVTAGGWLDNSGNFLVNGTPAQVEAALQGLKFLPTAGAAPVVGGEVFKFTLSLTDGIQNTASWNGSTGNRYAAGTLLSTFDNGATWTSFAADGFDVHFQTFVIPN